MRLKFGGKFPCVAIIKKEKMRKEIYLLVEKPLKFLKENNPPINRKDGLTALHHVLVGEKLTLYERGEILSPIIDELKDPNTGVATLAGWHLAEINDTLEYEKERDNKINEPLDEDECNLITEKLRKLYYTINKNKEENWLCRKKNEEAEEIKRVLYSLSKIYPLSKIKHKLNIPIFRQCLLSDDWEIRKKAIRTLIDLNDYQSFSAMFDRINDNYVQDAVLYAIQEFPSSVVLQDKRVIPFLLNTLKDRRSYLRKEVESLLLWLESKQINDALKDMILDHSDSNTKIAAINILSTKGDETAINLIANVLNNEDIRIRSAAVIALGRIKSSACAPYLMYTLNQKEPYDSKLSHEKNMENAKIIKFCAVASICVLKDAGVKITALDNMNEEEKKSFALAFEDYKRHLKEKPDFFDQLFYCINGNGNGNGSNGNGKENGKSNVNVENENH